MCGIAGFLDPGLRWGSEDIAKLAESMAATIAHRGPDDSGSWVDLDAGVAFGHRRLAIVDLSPAGHQPMTSSNGRFVVVFNGEIYNHHQLRIELGEHAWRGHSDTETLLAGVECWGLKETLLRSTGMFALALWDRQERELTLARDRMGEKPLYYGWQGGAFLFGSELKALRAHPACRNEIDRDALGLFMRHGYIPAPYSIYRGIRKLIPGTLLTLGRGHTVAGVVPDPETYWSLHDVVVAGMASPFDGDDAEAIAELQRRLTEAIRLQRVADVPLGAFLSGGLDSSLVAALMQAQSSRPVKTFTIGFQEQRYNEAHHAKAVAHHLGTDHTELYVTARQAQEVIPSLPRFYDEPFGDSSQIPTYLISRLARQKVTVALSGDGGDELFGGYSRYFKAAHLWRRMQLLSPGVRDIIARGITAVAPDVLTVLLAPVLTAVGRGTSVPAGERLSALAAALRCHHDVHFYRLMISHWRSPLSVVPGARELPTILTRPEAWPALSSFEARLMYADALTYLPDDILAKVDRAAMGESLETRVPFLDHRVVEFAWRLPLSMKMRSGEGKWIVRQLLYNHVPKPLVDRPKRGFGVPVGDWLRGPLREWAESLLNVDRLKREGWFCPESIRKRWQQHRSGKYDWSDSLWSVLAFQSWLAEHPA